MVNIKGFTLLRNGVKYDYPFMESLQSLLDLTGEVYLALGKGEDQTEEKLKSLSGLKIKDTIWDDDLRSGGEILSQQTNIALEYLREEVRDGWGFYLQTDEVISEDDYELIKSDIGEAENSGYDAISFRYFHFWQRYDQIAIKKNWYPHEIRAVKLDSKIESYGDAQSFRNHTKIFYSEAIIYHYGHVREKDKYQLKKHDFNKLWHPDENLKKVEARSRKKEKIQPTLKYLGPHPRAMSEKILNSGVIPTKVDGINILISKDQKVNSSLISKIGAKKVNIVHSRSELNPDFKTVSIKKSFFDALFYNDRIPKKMRSKLAKDWSIETILKLKLALKGIGIG